MVKLADVLLSTSTIKWKKVNSSQSFQYIDLSSVNRSSHKITQTANITSLNAPSRAQKIIQTDDVLFGTTRPTLNRLCIVDEIYDKQICSTGLCVLRADIQKIIPGYIYYLLTTSKFVNYIEAIQRGTSYPAVTDKDVKEFQFDLPSIHEQWLIVTKLNAAFEKIDRAAELTDLNINNAKKLYDSFLNKEFEPSEQWSPEALESNVRFIDYRGKTPKKTEDGIRLITAKNIRLGYLNKEPEEYVSPDIYESWMVRGIPIKGDVLFTTEAPLANVAQLDTDEHVVFAQRCIILQPNRDLIDPEFLKYSLLAGPVRSSILDNATGTTVSGIRAALLKKIKVYLPAKNTQKLIVARVNNVRDHSDALTKEYERKAYCLQSLKQSLLNEAFTESTVK
jgi:type I restriction enzyme S subunit